MMALTPIESESGQNKTMVSDGTHCWDVVGWVGVDGTIYGYKEADGKPRVSTTPYLYDISEGNIAGHEPRRILGRNEGVTTTLTDLTEIAGGSIKLPTTAQAVEVVSTSADDAGGGIGVQQIEVHYLDNDWNEISQEITLTGLTPVNLSFPALRFNGVHSLSVGSNNNAVGNIIIRDQGGLGDNYIQITAGDTTSLHGAFSVPLGKSAFIVGWAGSSGKGKETEVRLSINADPHTFTKTDGAYNTHDFVSVLSQTRSKNFSLPIKCPEKTDIILKAIVTDTGTVTATGTVELWIE
jgi:hypothetical protein